MGKDDVESLVTKAYEAGRQEILALLTPQERDKVNYLLEKGADTTDYTGRDFLRVQGIYDMTKIYKRMADSVEV